MADIYDQHQAAFNQVAAFCIFEENVLRARVAIKYPRDGAGRQYAYVHWLGSPMVRGFASGGGYDKNSACVADAARKIESNTTDASRVAFIQAARRDSGRNWQRELEKAGFTVFQAV